MSETKAISLDCGELALNLTLIHSFPDALVQAWLTALVYLDVFCSCDKRYSDNYLSAPVLARLWKLGLAGFKPGKSGKQTLENSEIRLIEGKMADSAIRGIRASEAFDQLLGAVPKPVAERKSPVTGRTRRETKNNSQLAFRCTNPTCRRQQKVRGVRSTYVRCGYCGCELKLVGQDAPISPTTAPPTVSEASP